MPFIVSLESSLSLDWLRDGKALETVQCTVKQSSQWLAGYNIEKESVSSDTKDHIMLKTVLPLNTIDGI